MHIYFQEVQYFIFEVHLPLHCPGINPEGLYSWKDDRNIPHFSCKMSLLKTGPAFAGMQWGLLAFPGESK